MPLILFWFRAEICICIGLRLPLGMLKVSSIQKIPASDRFVLHEGSLSSWVFALFSLSRDFGWQHAMGRQPSVAQPDIASVAVRRRPFGLCCCRETRLEVEVIAAHLN